MSADWDRLIGNAKLPDYKKPPPAPEVKTTWVCACGKRNWAHAQNCPACGERVAS